MTTSIRGNDPDLIAGALYHLGYRPRECLLVLGLRAEVDGRSTVALTARVDLPDGRCVETTAEDLAGLMLRAGAASLVVVLVTELSRSKARNLGGRLRSVFVHAGLLVLHEYQLLAEHYRGLECRDRDCCPHPGRPLAEVLESPGAAACVAEGMTLVGSAEELVADVRPAPAVGSAADAARPAREQLGLWLAALEDPDARLPDDFAEALSDVRLRDAVMLSLCGGSAEEARRSLTDFDAMDAFMTGRPDQVWHGHATALLAGAARVATADGRLEVLALLAWLAWWQGAGTRARLLVAEVLEQRPDHRLGGLVGSALTAGLPPPWSVRSAVGVE